MIGPEVYITVYGNLAPNYPVVMQREYSVPRGNLGEELAILLDIEKFGEDHDYKLAAVVPVIADDLGRIVVLYYYKTLEELGIAIDQIGVSEEFQKIVLKANALGYSYKKPDWLYYLAKNFVVHFIWPLLGVANCLNLI